jgi:hypothetical protein
LRRFLLRTTLRRCDNRMMVCCLFARADVRVSR